ncbi:hypothetical protein I7I51_07295 [Histoplasma capsulatum]|uniref:Uncharacterized protein n=1 Tax=Ajellomyces capsulatus TaxID=5037 RepID=A0A8A1MIJ3_AJECA|nr:hypothetical protein I7I51_07295 [Histoplasma capsulatum]
MPDDDWGSQDPGGDSDSEHRNSGLCSCNYWAKYRVHALGWSRGVVADNQPSASPQKTGRLDSGPNQRKVKKERKTIPTDGHDHGIIITWPSFGNTPHKILIQARKSSQGRKKETKTLARFRFVPTHPIASSAGSPFPVPSTPACTGDHEAFACMYFWPLLVPLAPAPPSTRISGLKSQSRQGSTEPGRGTAYCSSGSLMGRGYRSHHTPFHVTVSSFMTSHSQTGGTGDVGARIQV